MANDDKPSDPVASVRQCAPSRLAEPTIAAADLRMCSRDGLHIHLGALALGVSARIPSDLPPTFGQAVAARAAYKWFRSPEVLLSTSDSHSTGET